MRSTIDDILVGFAGFDEGGMLIRHRTEVFWFLGFGFE
jgi:hypothetical protein